MPLIQITTGRHYPDEVARELLRRVTEVAHEVTGTPVAGIRVWLVEVPPGRLMAAGKTLAELAADTPSDAAALLGPEPAAGP